MGGIFRAKQEEGSEANEPVKANSERAIDGSDLHQDEVCKQLVQYTAQRIGHDVEIDAKVDIFDAGYVDSISAVEFLGEIKSTYNVDIQEVQLVSSLNSLDAIANFIVTKSAGAQP